MGMRDTRIERIAFFFKNFHIHKVTSYPLYPSIHPHSFSSLRSPFSITPRASLRTAYLPIDH